MLLSLLFWINLVKFIHLSYCIDNTCQLSEAALTLDCSYQNNSYSNMTTSERIKSNHTLIRIKFFISLLPSVLKEEFTDYSVMKSPTFKIGYLFFSKEADIGTGETCMNY